MINMIIILVMRWARFEWRYLAESELTYIHLNSIGWSISIAIPLKSEHKNDKNNNIQFIIYLECECECDYATKRKELNDNWRQKKILRINISARVVCVTLRHTSLSDNCECEIISKGNKKNRLYCVKKVNEINAASKASTISSLSLSNLTSNAIT